MVTTTSELLILRLESLDPVFKAHCRNALRVMAVWMRNLECAEQGMEAQYGEHYHTACACLCSTQAAVHQALASCGSPTEVLIAAAALRQLLANMHLVTALNLSAFDAKMLAAAAYLTEYTYAHSVHPVRTVPTTHTGLSGEPEC